MFPALNVHVRPFAKKTSCGSAPALRADAALDFFVTAFFWLNYSSRTTLAPLLVSLEDDLGVGHTARQQPVLMSLCMPMSSILSAGIAPLFLGWTGERLGFAAGMGCAAAASLLSIGAVRLLRNRARNENSDAEKAKTAPDRPE